MVEREKDIYIYIYINEHRNDYIKRESALIIDKKNHLLVLDIAHMHHYINVNEW
jgi:hypothetical protein